MLAAAWVLLALPVVPAGAAASRGVADLLDVPAVHGARAVHSLQLAVARAGDRLVSVGERGIVLLSDDHGRSWRQAQSVPASVALTAVHFVSARLGWAVGHSGVVVHTADGGETWVRQLDGLAAAQLVLRDAQARAADGDEAGARAVREAERLVEEGPDKPFLAVHFADPLRGWVVGAYGLALGTVDGGLSWHSLVGRIPNPGARHLYDLRAAGGELLVAGEQGVLFRSSDGGERFTRLETPYAGTFFGVVPLDDAGILAYGLRGNAWRSADGGASWQRVELGQAVTATAGLRLADGSVVLADESGRLLRSAVGATAFAPLPVPAVAGLTGIVQAADGGVVLSGARGALRVEPAVFESDNTR